MGTYKKSYPQYFSLSGAISRRPKIKYFYGNIL